MDILKKYSQYIKASLTEPELDSFTREIVKEYFEKEKLQGKWEKILQKEYDLEGTTEQPKETPSLNHSGRIRAMRMVLSAVASIALVLLSWLAYSSLLSSPYEKLLSEELNKPYIEAISRKGSVEALKLKAVEAYNDREYAIAEKYFEEISKNEEKVDWAFYIGLCQLYQEQADLAIQTFTIILKQPDKKHEIETHWYIGLAYTMNEDFTSAKKHMQFVLDHSDNNMEWKIKETRAFLSAFREQE